MATVDFFIRPLVQLSGVVIWLVSRETMSACVGVHDTCEQATAAAKRMADYEISLMRHTQIHVQDTPHSDWRTVWVSPAKSEPRFEPRYQH